MLLSNNALYQLIAFIIALGFGLVVIQQNLYNQEYWNNNNKKIFISFPRITGWHISHFFTFFFLGFLIPKFKYILIIMGVI
jgi:hypothetical protein